MRYVMITALFAMLSLGRPQNSSAVAMDDYPAGTYQQSCKDIRLRGDDLRARCRDGRGHYRDAFLDGADRCWGDISNNDGRLVCNKNGSLPAGGYSQTCRKVRVRYNVLRAKCQTGDGGWTDTALESFASCNGAIENIYGQLRCMVPRRDHDDGYRDRDRDRDHDGDRDRDRDRIPGGSYSQTCRDIRSYGNSLRAMCQSGDGRWVWSELHDWDDCRGGIQNINGNLRCVR